MLTFVCDDLQKGFVNLYPLKHQGQDLTEPCWLIPWLDYYHIDYNTVDAEKATPESWYPISINFWDFNCNYLQHLPEVVKEKLVQQSLRLLLLYREADDPGLIRQHIKEMCNELGVDVNQIWLISGNSLSDDIPNCKFFWFFDINYFFQTKNSHVPTINGQPRSRQITCLSRVHKQWREWFVYNLSRSVDFKRNYISYGTVDHNLNDINIWERPDYRCVDNVMIDIVPPSEEWRSLLPVKADDLDSTQHNTHSIVVEEHYQNSYWNIILETLLDTENHGGIFVTEKTLKPIRNGQSFLVLGCAGTLEFLKSRGYQTFGDYIDESYDSVESIHDRWYYVYRATMELANLSTDKLEKLQLKCLPIIKHNQEHFQRSRINEIEKLTAYLDSV